jgi:pimeloyl-ACP methyl ester carboxylesterase
LRIERRLAASVALRGRDPEQAVRDCLRGLDADPAQYTTVNAIADLDEVRARLGYDKLNLWGGSYGTRVGLE